MVAGSCFKLVLIFIILLFGSLLSGLTPSVTVATTQGNETEDQNQEVLSQQTDNSDTSNETNDNLQGFESILPTNCPELPDDGRPQPSKGANKDPDTWKVVPMRDDPNLFKVVDNAGINVADLFDSKANAEQYVAHFVCDMPPPSNQSPEEPRQAEICNDGIDNDQDGSVDETILCIIGPEICNDGIDNDQDGSVDEKYLSGQLICVQLPTESDPSLPDSGAGEPPALPERPICPFPLTIEAIEAGCIEGPDKPSNAIYCTRGVTCYGTDGPDFIQGTALDDTIESLSGNDRIDGKFGNDVIRSGAGDDIVYGDDGSDTIYAGIGHDTIYGGFGADTILGGLGRDEIYGEEGDDTIYHNSKRTNASPSPTAPDGSFDEIYCGPGDDKVWMEKTYDEDAKLNGDPYYEPVFGCEVENDHRLGSYNPFFN